MDDAAGLLSPEIAAVYGAPDGAPASHDGAGILIREMNAQKINGSIADSSCCPDRSTIAGSKNDAIVPHDDSVNRIAEENRPQVNVHIIRLSVPSGTAI